MACENIIETYREWKTKQEAKGFTKEVMDKAWIAALREKRTGENLAILNRILEGNAGVLEIAIAYNNTSKTVGVQMLDVRLTDTGTVKLFVENGVYEFEIGETKNIVVQGNVGKVKYAYVPVMELTKNTTLGSSEDMRTKLTEKELKKFQKLEADIHGNPEKMVDLLNEINKLDGTKTADMEGLTQLLKEMDPKFFTKMNTYIRDSATENGGVIDGKNIAINISKARRLDGNKQTAAEAYVHEIVHAYTRFAVEAARNGDAETRRILDKLEYIMKVAKANTTWQHMLGEVAEVDATDKQKADAKEMYRYIFLSEHAEDEFMAHVLTNPIVKKHMQKILVKEESKDKTLLGRVKELWNYITGLLVGDYKFNDKSANIQEATKVLAFMFAEYNNRAVVKAAQSDTLIEKLKEGFSTLDEDTGAKLHEWMKKIMPAGEIEPKPEGQAAQALWFAKVIAKMALDKEYRKATMTMLDQLGWMNISGSIGSIIRDFIEGDKTSNAVDWLSVQSDKIDQSKMNVAAVTSDIVTKGFKKALTQEMDEALTTVILDTDLQSVMKYYTQNQLIAMLEDSAKLDAALITAKIKLKEADPQHEGWNVNQAAGLGHYMITGKAHYAQLLNAWNIARGIGSEKRRKAQREIVDAIDRVATLQALHQLRYEHSKELKIVAKMMKDEWEGVEIVIQTAKAIHKESMETILKGNEAFAIKGYSKELFDDQIEMEVAPTDAEAEMNAKGFKKVHELKDNKLINTKTKYAIYVSTSYTTNDWNRASTRLTKNHTKGTTLKDIWYAEDTTYSHKKYIINKKKIDVERYELISKMNDKNLDLTTVDYGLSPVIDQYGDIVGYRVMMEKGMKKDLLKQNKRATDVLGATKATLLDKQQSKKHNEKVLDLIKEDAKENYIPGQSIGKDQSVYVLIKDGSTDAELQEIWDIMPAEFRTEALKNAEKGLPVRKDLLHNYFGYRELSLVNMPLLKDYMPQIIKSAIRIAEAIWKEFIKITKVDILIKMPFVLVGNILSNIVYAINTGSSPLEILRMYIDSTRNVLSYLKKHRELVKLEQLVTIGKATTMDKERIVTIKRELVNNSSVHELYELGVYQAIVEDVSKEEMSSKNRLKQNYKDRAAKVPKIVKDGLNWLYLTEETQLYKFATEVLQMSDLVARDIENKKMKEMIALQAKGKKPLPLWYVKHLEETQDEEGFIIRVSSDITNRRRAMGPKEKAYFEKVAKAYKDRAILNNFVNYNKLSGPVEEYLNKMGFIMFTKYAKRIQKVIVDTGATYPLKSMAILLFDSFIWDMDTIQDQQIFTKSWYNLTPKDPFSMIMNVLQPALVQTNTTYRFL